mgnify:CR=1 FL=1
MTEKIVGWQYQRDIPASKVDAFEQVIEPVVEALDVSETPEDGAMRRVTLFFPGGAERSQLISSLTLAEEVAGVATQGQPVFVQPVYDEDWQEKMHRSFPPITESGFFIHGFDEAVPEDKISLQIPAGMAFGTGEHVTTAMCLRLYEDLSARRTFKNGLDMGAGSGILAIAAAKVQQTPFLCVDIDDPSTRACRENAVNNGVSELVSAITGEGFGATGVTPRSPYDIIFANILQNPLIGMADDMAQHTSGGGFIILSGFTTEQQGDVLEAYKPRGFELHDTLSRDEWCAVSMVRK